MHGGAVFVHGGVVFVHGGAVFVDGGVVFVHGGTGRLLSVSPLYTLSVNITSWRKLVQK